MITKPKTMISVAIVFAVGISCGALFVLDSEETAAQVNGKISIHPTADVHPTAILEGEVTIGAYTVVSAGCVLTGNVTVGHHSLIRCNTVIRGKNTIGNYTHIYDLVNIEGGRPAKVGSSAAQVPDQSIIGDNCWINHGSTMHGTQIGDGGAVGLNACCDYNTRIGKGAVLANGSATHINQVIPDNAFAEGVPAIIKKENITENDRLEYFGVLPSGWTRYAAEGQEADIRKQKGIVD